MSNFPFLFYCFKKISLYAPLFRVLSLIIYFAKQILEKYDVSIKLRDSSILEAIACSATTSRLTTKEEARLLKMHVLWPCCRYFRTGALS